MPPAPINYTFTGTGNWTDAGNWVPGYPGEDIGPGYTITISGDCTMKNVVTSHSPITITPGSLLKMDRLFGFVFGDLTMDGAALTNEGTLQIEVGYVRMTNGSTLVNNGTFINNQVFEGSIVLEGTGTLNGTGRFADGFTNSSSSTVAPGASLGCMTFNSSFENQGTVAIEVNGPTACTEYDSVNVSGMATLGGTLNINIGYTPTSNAVITFLQANAISGTFAVSPTLPANWTIEYDNPNSGQVSLLYTVPPTNYVFSGTGNWTDIGNWAPSYPGTDVGAIHTVTIDGMCTLNADVTSEAPITINSGASLTLASNLTMSASLLTNDGDLTVNSGKQLSFQMGGGGLTHNGTSATINGYLDLGGYPFSNTLTINSGTTLTVAGNLTSLSNNVNNNGTLVINGSFTNVGGNFNNNGTLKGTSGTIGGYFINPSGGTIAPGGSPGCLTFSDGWENQGTISIEVNGATSCSGHDKINVNNDVTIGGTLNITFGGGYTPTNGAAITFLQANAISGTFSSINPALPTGWTVRYNYPSTGQVSLYYTTDYVFTTAGNWNNTANWTPGYPGTTVPANFTVTIAAACILNINVTCAGPMTINTGASFTMNGLLTVGNTFTNNGDFTVNSTLTIGNAFTNNGNFTVNNGKSVNIQSGGTLTHNGTNASIGGPMSNSGSFVVNAGKSITFTANGTLTHDGTNASIAGTLTLTGNCTVNAGKTMIIETGGTLIHNGNNISSFNIWGTLTNDGTFSMTGGFANVFINPGGTFTHNGTSAVIQGALTNAGALNVNAGKTLTIGGTIGSFTHNGTSASISGNLITGVSGGTITVSAGKTLTINSGGSFTQNNGGVSISGTFINNGDLTLTATGSSNTFNINSGGTFTHSGTSASISRHVQSGGSFNVSSGSTLTINSSSFGFQVNSGTVTIAGTLVSNTQCLFSSGTLNIVSGGTLTHNGTALAIGAGSISSGGTLTQNGSNANITSGTFTNNGTLNVNAGKTLNVSYSGTFIQNSATATIYGTLADANGTSTTINAGQTLTIANGGSYMHTGSTLTISGTLAVNSGGAFTQNASSPMNVAGTISNEGTVTVSGGRTLSVSSGGTFTNNGTVTNSGTFSNSGTLNGTGSFTGSSINNNSGGTIAPGGAPGCLSFSGINSSSGSTLSIEVNGLTACSGFDKITASSSVSINGTLSLSVGYSPTIGDVITIIEASSISGTFSGVNPPSSGWTALYNNPSNGKVSVRYNGPPPPAPNNDDCTAPLSISVSPTGACSPVSGTTASANLSKQFNCSFGGGETYLDTWYSFTAPAGGSVTFRSGIGSPYASIYADCNNSSPVANGCIRGSGTVVGLSPGVTYYLQVLTPGSEGIAFDFCLETSGTPPTNEACASATPLDLGNPTTVNSLYAVTNALPPCAPLPSLNAPDLWYTFTAPSGGVIDYSSVGSTILLTIYSGTCSGLITVACAVPLSGPPPTLTPGVTYYAQISSLGATETGTATITSPGVYNFTGAVSNEWNNANNWTSGVLPGNASIVTISNGETCNLDVNFTSSGSTTIASGGTLNVRSGIILGTSVTNNGTVGGVGTISGSFTSNGTIAPGFSPGCLNFGSNFTSSGTMSIEVNGTTACTQYDKVTVAGTASLSGTLSVNIGYTPSNGNVITFLEAGAISGTFTTISPALPAGWSIAYNNPAPGKVSLAFVSLPIELLDFKATLQKEKTSLLTWHTVTETNNQGFDIERSSDGKTWERLDFMSGHGTTSEVQAYAYTDERPLPGTNYYRLRQMDFDGNFENSPTVSVEMKQESGIHLFPNPASGNVTLALKTDYIGDAMLTCYDLTGKKVKTQVLALDGGPLRIRVDLSDLPGSGMYLLTVKAGQEQWQQRVVVE